MSENVFEISDDTFEDQVLQSDVPVLVDFWAPWCGPCRQLSPTVEQVADEYKGKAKFVKLNVDDNMDTSTRFNIKGIPTLLLFRDGVIKDQIVGNTSRDNIARMIENQLQEAASA